MESSNIFSSKYKLFCLVLVLSDAILTLVIVFLFLKKMVVSFGFN